MNSGKAMGSHIEIAMSVVVISIVMCTASLLFKDKEGDKPARFAFRLFYFSAVIFFIASGINIQSPSSGLEGLSNLSFAITNASLTIGILWRCKSYISINYIIILALVYLVLDTSINSAGLQISYIYNIFCSLVCVYALLNRANGGNTGDKGMAVVILLNAVLLIANIVSFSGILTAGSYSQFMVMVFIFTPAYLGGVTIFLFASYMLDAHDELALQATTDHMTGLYNRRFFLAESKRALQLASRHKDALCVMICDIDHFKEVNDTYGHAIGDRVLKEFAEILKNSLRSEDILARYGGEEFVALLPQTNKEKALFVAERMRSETEDLSIATEKGDVRLTACFGVSTVHEYSDIETSINQADKALYEAKSSGRNLVKCYLDVLAS